MRLLCLAGSNIRSRGSGDVEVIPHGQETGTPREDAKWFDNG